MLADEFSLDSFNTPKASGFFPLRGLSIGLLWLAYGMIGWHLFQNFAWSQALLGITALMGLQLMVCLPQITLLGQALGSWCSQTVLRICLVATVLFLGAGFLLWSQSFDKLLLLLTSEVLVRLDFHQKQMPALQGSLLHLGVPLSGLILGGVISTQV